MEKMHWIQKVLRYLIGAILLFAVSGCYPVFVPAHGGRGHEHHDHHDRGYGGYHHDRD